MSDQADRSNPPSDTSPGAPDPLRIVLADDEVLFRASLRQLITLPPSIIKDVYGVDVGAGFDVVGEAGTGAELVDVARATKPDLVLFEIAMPRLSGLAALRELGPSAPPAIVLAERIHNAELLTAVQLGVRGFLLKDAATEALFDAMVTVVGGRHWVAPSLVADLLQLVGKLGDGRTRASVRPFGLTRREREVLTLVAAGYANKEIAETCAVSEETVKHHLTRMFDKVGASSRVELAMLASHAGLVGET
jgi:two-component system, NarL family, nitrate/nitrite response regulator NarL